MSTELRWDRDTLEAPHTQPDKAQRVQAMFDAIAPTYERVNSVASFGRDAAWRRRAVRAAQVRAGDVALDVCCGTGDMVRELARQEPPPARIIGVDFAAQMLAAGDFATSRCTVEVQQADALALPLADAAVDVITCAFGVRNFNDLGAGLREMSRVARPGARVAILEFSMPDNAILRWLYRTYTERIMPRLATWLSRDRTGAYRYLPASIRTFVTANGLAAALREAGFANVRAQRMNLGGVVIVSGVKP